MKNHFQERLYYVDNLRTLIIVLVVILHLAVTYSGNGSWYITDAGSQDIASQALFGLFQSFTQAYFMGFLFLISGFFAVKSLARKGGGRFLHDRFFRLGVPTLLYMLAIHPFIVYVLLGSRWERPTLIRYYVNYLIHFDFISSSGPLWFAFALLIFSVIYVIFSRGIHLGIKKSEAPFPNLSVKLGLIVVIAAAAFLIRQVQPIGTNIINMQLCFFSQYIILFLVGIQAGNHNWFAQISYGEGKKWLIVGIGIGIPVWGLLMTLGGELSRGFAGYAGGLTWQCAAYALWESFVSVAMAIGLLGVFQEKYNHHGKMSKVLSQNSFAVYVFHAPVIIGISLVFTHLSVHPIIKFMFAVVIGLPLIFLLTHLLLRKIPGLRCVIFTS